jgi:hypothetical protein
MGFRKREPCPFRTRNSISVVHQKWLGEPLLPGILIVCRTVATPKLVRPSPLLVAPASQLRRPARARDWRHGAFQRLLVFATFLAFPASASESPNLRAGRYRDYRFA